MFSIECNVGRLVEARPLRFRTPEDVAAYGRATADVLVRFRPPRTAVICADHRAVGIYPPEVATAFAELLSRINPRVERAALLVAPGNATLALQLGRLVSEAAHRARRVFTDRAAFVAYASQVLDDAERARLEVFLDSAPVPPPGRP